MLSPFISLLLSNGRFVTRLDMRAIVNMTIACFNVELCEKVNHNNMGIPSYSHGGVCVIRSAAFNACNNVVTDTHNHTWFRLLGHNF
jgi:hypothetical protein